MSDDRVVGLDDDDRPCRRVCHVGLRVRRLDRVAAFGIGLGEVGALLDEGPHDCPRDRAVPAVKVGRAQKGLIDGPTDKPIDRLVVGEHVLQRIGLAFDPEAVLAGHVSGDAVRGRLSGVGDHRIVIGAGDRTLTVFEASGEEVVPGGETPVLVCRIVLELLDTNSPSGLSTFPARR
jgi:hypothetical protein